MFAALRDTTVSINFVPDIFITYLIQGHFDSLNGIPVVGVCDTPFYGVNGIVKRGSDIILSILILLLISPLMLAIALGIKFSSPGPVLFVQRRYGLDGKEILDVYKRQGLLTLVLLLAGMLPVSYTHLDVYKRQVLARATKLRANWRRRPSVCPRSAWPNSANTRWR